MALLIVISSITKTLTSLAVISVSFKPSRKSAGATQGRAKKIGGGSERGVAEKERRPHPTPLAQLLRFSCMAKTKRIWILCGVQNVRTISINLDLRFFRFASFFVGEVDSDWAHFAVPSCWIIKVLIKQTLGTETTTRNQAIIQQSIVSRIFNTSWY